MFCITMEPSHINFIKNLDYVPVGLGEKKFSKECLQDKTGENIALKNKNIAYISRYALGRDYHKVIRSKLKKLVAQIKSNLDKEFHFRLFTDSAPVLEVDIAEKAGLGWRGKHTLLLNKEHGSWFFFG